MKKLLVLLLGIISVFALVACSKEEPNENPGDNPGTEDPGTDDPGTDDKVTVELNETIVATENVGEISIKLSVKDNNDSSVAYVIVPDKSLKPSAKEVFAGEYGSITIHKKDSAATIDKVETLDGGTAYTVYTAGKIGTDYSAVGKVELTTADEADQRGTQISIDCSKNTTDINGEEFYNICTVADLEAIGTTKVDGDDTSGYERNGTYLSYSLNGNYIIGADIDLGTKYNEASWATGTKWVNTPLGGYDDVNPTGGAGTSASGFKGIFDGNGFTISNLYIGETAITTKDGGIGLFAYVGESAATGILRNITIDRFEIIVGNDYEKTKGVGALVGAFRGEKMENIKLLNSTIKLSDSYTGNEDIRLGGIVGRVKNSGSKEQVIRNLFVDENTLVKGEKSTGGAIGYAGFDSDSSKKLLIENIESHATVTGTSNVGGAIGSLYSASVDNIVATGSVTGTSNTGLVIGSFEIASKNKAGYSPYLGSVIAINDDNSLKTLGKIKYERTDAKDGPVSITTFDGTDTYVGFNVASANLDETANMFKDFDTDSVWQFTDNTPSLKHFFKA